MKRYFFALVLSNRHEHMILFCIHLPWPMYLFILPLFCHRQNFFRCIFFLDFGLTHQCCNRRRPSLVLFHLSFLGVPPFLLVLEEMWRVAAVLPCMSMARRPLWAGVPLRVHGPQTVSLPFKAALRRPLPGYAPSPSSPPPSIPVKSLQIDL